MHAYKQSYPGDWTLEESAIQVNKDEGVGYVFAGNSVGAGENEFSYDYHPEGLFPPPCFFRKKGAKVPAGFTRGWSGRMMDGGQEVDAILWRKDA